MSRASSLPGRARLPTLLQEASAMARQARMLTLDLGESHWPGDGARAVLVHGLYATAGVFRPMREMLRAELGLPSSTFSYGLGPGILELRARLEEVIERAPGTGPLHLIGHSLGGLVISDYVQRGRLDARVAQTVTLSAPFRGSRLSGLVPREAGRDLELGAPILSLLRTGNERRRYVPQLTVEAGSDGRVEPAARPEFGEHVILPGATHNAILFDPRAWQLIAERIRQLSPATGAPER